jgi:hypothetical protein
MAFSLYGTPFFDTRPPRRLVAVAAIVFGVFGFVVRSP